jgi:hypothetical protein
MTRQFTGTLGFFNVALDYTRCDVVGGAGEGGVRTSIFLCVGVKVVQLGVVGLAMRVLIGEPFGAICCGVGACEGTALLRIGDVGLALFPRPPLLPPPLGLEWPRPPAIGL